MKGFEGMKKYSFIALFFALMLGLSTTVAWSCTPGCSGSCAASPIVPAPQGPAGGGGSNPANSAGNSGGILGAMQRRADAKRLEDKAQTRQHVKQNDNGPGMTCFDRAIAMTQQLGQIFSDTGPGFVLPRSADIFPGGSSYPDMGLSNWLGQGLNAVVSPMLQSHVGNFTDSLSAALGATVANYLNTLVSQPLTGLNDLVNQFTGPITAINTAMASINGWYATIESILNALGTTMPAAIPGVIATVTGLWNLIQNMITTALGAVMTSINTVISQITSMITGMITAVLSSFSLGGDCERIAKLWGNGGIGIPAGFRSIIGSALEQGAPYFRLLDMLNRTIAGGGPDLLQEIVSNTTNDAIISRALSDLTGGMLSGPGNASMPTWPTPPIFPANAGTAAIIGSM